MAHAQVTAITGGTIIDGNGGDPVANGVIITDGRRITHVGERSTPIPPNAKRISAIGKFVIPGLMYPQVTLVACAWPPDLIRYEGRYDEVAIEAAQLALKAGVTTVFDWIGPREPLIEARNAVNEGRVTAARIYLCGHWIGCGGPFSPDILDHGKEEVGEHSFESKSTTFISAADVAFKSRVNALWEVNIGEALIRMPLEEVRQEVREYVRSGVDYVTYLVNAHRLPAYEYIAFSLRVQRMIVEEGHRAGLSVHAMFATTEEGVRLALDAGADIVTIGSYGGKPLSAEILALIAREGTFVHIIANTAQETEWYRRQPPNALYPGLLKQVETAAVDHAGLIRVGAQVISAGWNAMQSAEMQSLSRSATAAPRVAEIGEGHFGGLQGLQDKGMAPMDALIATTRNVARAFKVDKELGTLEPGKVADLVVLDSNPLESAQNYRDIHLVMKEGDVVDRDALPSQRLFTASTVD